MKKRIVIASIVLMILTIGTIGGTFATSYFKDNANVKNTVKIGATNVTVIEEIDEQGKKNVGVQIPANTSSCWVRIFVSLPTTLSGDPIYTAEPVIDFTSSSCKWSYNSDDGYYYSKEPYQTSSSSIDILLFKTITANNIDEKELPSNFDIIIYAEAVQDNGESSGIQAFSKLKQSN